MTINQSIKFLGLKCKDNLSWLLLRTNFLFPKMNSKNKTTIRNVDVKNDVLIRM